MYGRGHVTGTKRERTPATPWWAEEEERTIQAVEREWAAQTTQSLPKRVVSELHIEKKKSP